jgi:hypothetical protein
MLPLDTSSGGASGAITTSSLTMATNKVLGRATASTGAIEEIGIGTGLALSAGNLIATGTSVATVTIAGITDLGTGVGTALAANVGAAGAPVTFNGALGTPSAGTLTNATGYLVSKLAGAGIGVPGALGAGTGLTGGMVVVGGVLGTPASGTATNLTGLPVSTGLAGAGIGVPGALSQIGRASCRERVFGFV